MDLVDKAKVDINSMVVGENFKAWEEEEVGFNNKVTHLRFNVIIAITMVILVINANIQKWKKEVTLQQ